MGRFFGIIAHKLNSKPYLMIAIVIIVAGLYLLVTSFAPKLPSMPLINKANIDLNTKDDTADERDRIQITKLKIEVPFYEGSDDSVLDRGAWHRWPERGNPLNGGNFILSAHRFEMGFTPSQTRQKSPFYNIHELNAGDDIRVFYEGRWYLYKVSKKYEVAQTALYIEAPSSYAKLTLYSCSLKGAADGRYVIEALPAQNGS